MSYDYTCEKCGNNAHTFKIEKVCATCGELPAPAGLAVQALRGALAFIADFGGKKIDTECGTITCTGAWCADQAESALSQNKHISNSDHMREDAHIIVL